ncbi:hypothetical protein SAMN06269185_1840 [Natronoarchaeum philippinense]|uniref:Uncharacterized protein n=1 Tax=Natronoarchaeum philippinense TaxID=558529 RepID=A0A285NUB8_NATPI|nr:hypothetical protein [Natronoarchaeum philippinense]SNZ12627.1 hypothetical protein SAMN06269185_1840 [Natronoarchaeum philippinense]
MIAARDGDTAARAQLVLVAAAVIAVGLAPIALAYVQLGAAPVDAAGVADRSDGDVSRALDRAVHDTAAGVPSNYAWNEREAAVDAVNDQLGPRIETLRTSRLRAGVVRGIAYNTSAATAWADARCPSGPDRQFGACEAIDGVVVQDRAGRTHVLGAVFDLRVTTERQTVRSTVRIETATLIS